MQEADLTEKDTVGKNQLSIKIEKWSKNLGSSINNKLKRYKEAHFIKFISPKLKKEVTSYKKYIFVNSENEKKLFYYFRHYKFQELARDNFIDQIMTYFVLLPIALLFCPLMIITPALLKYRYDLKINILFILISCIVSSFFSFKIFTRIMLITVVFKKLQLAKWWFFLWLFMFIIILIFYNHFLPIAKSSLISVTFIAILLQEIGCMFFLCIITTGFSGCSFIANRIHSYFYPISFIINEYFNILFLLRKQKPTFINTAYRQNLLNKMESVAYCIQNNLCNRLKSNDIALDKWFENITCEIASSLRQKKQLILFPNPNSKDLLCKYFENALVDIVTANWDNLEKVKPENYSVRQLLTDRIKNLFHILIIGAIPVICLSVIQNTKLALHNPFLDYVILACMLWFISTLLINIDPLFVVKVGIFKELKHILSFSRKK